MLATIFLVVATPLLAFALLQLLALRAVPLCAAGATLWAIGQSSGNWGAAILAALFVGLSCAFALERLRAHAVTETGVMMVETVMGVGLTTLLAFAIFYSTGTRGTPLFIAMAATAGIALVTSLRQYAR